MLVARTWGQEAVSYYECAGCESRTFVVVVLMLVAVARMVTV